MSTTSRDCKDAWPHKCIKSEVIETWCQRRKELQSSIFCAEGKQTSMRFERYQGKVRSPEQKAKYQAFWVDIGLSPIGTDSLGSPIRVMCNASQEQKIKEDNFTPPQQRIRICNINFHLAEDVIGNISLKSFEPEDIRREALKMFEYSQTVWNALQPPAGNYEPAE